MTTTTSVMVCIGKRCECGSRLAGFLKTIPGNEGGFGVELWVAGEVSKNSVYNLSCPGTGGQQDTARGRPPGATHSDERNYGN